MIPIQESVRTRRTPWVTGLLVAVCVLVFLYELYLPQPALETLLQRWGAQPQSILSVLSGHPKTSLAVLLTLFTSQFLHAGWLHLLGNMVFLWVFGRPVEDRVGHFKYLALYLLGGAAAAIFQVWMGSSEPAMTLIGASGAIATILGTYFLFFPTAWVSVLVPIFFFFWTFDVPAVLMLAFWFLSQFFSGVASISHNVMPGNVAVWAHVGGFLTGLLVAIFLRATGLYQDEKDIAVSGAGGPGPVRLIRSVSDLAGLILAARILLELSGIEPSANPLGELANLIYGVSEPAVRLTERLLPPVVVSGRPLDLPALLDLLLVYLFAWLLIKALVAARPQRRSIRPAQ